MFYFLFFVLSENFLRFSCSWTAIYLVILLESMVLFGPRVSKHEISENQIGFELLGLRSRILLHHDKLMGLEGYLVRISFTCCRVHLSLSMR